MFSYLWVRALEKTKKSLVIWALIFLTLTYSIVFYFLVGHTKACPNTVEDGSPGIWHRYLECRQVNELGDTLGGAFAPIAFLWLAGAVLLQSQELQAQRQELNETQAVMREQLDVARQQVKETEASTTLFRQQTEILREEQNLRAQLRSNDAFNKTYNNIQSSIVSIGGRTISLIHKNGGTFSMQLFSSTYEDNPPIWAKRTLHVAEQLIDQLEEKVGAYRPKNPPPYFEIIQDTIEALEELEFYNGSLTEDYQILIDGMGIPHLRDRLSWLLHLLNGSPRVDGDLNADF